METKKFYVMNDGWTWGSCKTLKVARMLLNEANKSCNTNPMRIIYGGKSVAFRRMGIRRPSYQEEMPFMIGVEVQ